MIPTTIFKEGRKVAQQTMCTERLKMKQYKLLWYNSPFGVLITACVSTFKGRAMYFWNALYSNSWSKTSQILCATYLTIWPLNNVLLWPFVKYWFPEFHTQECTDKPPTFRSGSHIFQDTWNMQVCGPYFCNKCEVVCKYNILRQHWIKINPAKQDAQHTLMIKSVIPKL